MNEKLSVVRVFLASPGDLAAERTIVEGLVDETNRLWSAEYGVLLQLIRWERDVRPGIAEDAQAVVNNQISDDYDVLIGLLWAHFGTPTLRYSSGTQEEFERAIARFKETGSAGNHGVFQRRIGTAVAHGPRPNGADPGIPALSRRSRRLVQIVRRRTRIRGFAA